MFGKYFRNEKITYWFHCFFLLVLLLEIFLYVWTTHRADEEVMEMIKYFVLPLTVCSSVIMIATQIISLIIFQIRIHKLPVKQRNDLKKSVGSCKKTGRILQTQDLLIYYGMFSKKILLKQEIEKMDGKSEMSSIYSKGGRSILQSNHIVIQMKSGKQVELNCSIDVLDGYKGELPWNSMLVILLLGIAFLIMGLYPGIMDCLINKEDVIERVLFYAAYDYIFWILSVILIGIIGFIAFYLKCKNVKIREYKGDSIKVPVFWFVLILVEFLYIAFWQKSDDSDIARKDLEMYYNQQYEEKVIYAKDVKESFQTGGTWYIFEYLEDNNIRYAGLEGITESENQRESQYFLLVGDMEIKEIEKQYKIYYLKNTSIVVKVEAMAF